MEVASSQALSPTPNGEKPDQPDCPQPQDVSSASSIDLRSISINEASKGWKTAAAHVKNLKNATQAIGHVKLENKIGTAAADLEDGDPLKAVTLATQRALQSFGGAGTVQSVISDDLHRSVEFGAASAAAAAEETYSAHQPAFQCFEMCHDQFRDVREAFGISETRVSEVNGRRDSSSFCAHADAFTFRRSLFPDSR